MAKSKLTGKQLRSIGFPEGPVISIAIQVMYRRHKHLPHAEALGLLSRVLQRPAEYLTDPVLEPVARALMPVPPEQLRHVSLMTTAVPLAIFGSEFIEAGALEQMQLAAKLPIAAAGALMPDAHSGYGLPIGGVLATRNAVIPYGIGVDIGCRMCLSVFDLDPGELRRRESFFIHALQQATLFGSGRQFDKAADHGIMDRSEFSLLPLLRNLRHKAWKQLGSSGSGNHFVEFGELVMAEGEVLPGMAPAHGQHRKAFLALLSHSGSRALGAQIAQHYTRVARDKRKLPGHVGNLAWLNMNEEEGAEYWMAMNLAGDYASACHHIIHDKLARQLGCRIMARVENHHNFAWKEKHADEEWIVHRKGATPAAENVLGIIPGSMTAPGYVVRGKGDAGSLHSAAHGAGRQMSRSRAMASITQKQLRETLRQQQVRLIGGGLDEAPQAYKDIRQVMNSQQSLVDIIGRFTPRIVQMDGSPTFTH